MARTFYTDIEIINHIKNGNASLVLEHVYLTYEKETIRWVRRNNGNRAEGQDIFQESLLVFYEYVMNEKYDSKYPIGAFLMKVSKNKWINRTKKLNKEISNTDIHEKTYSFENHNNENKDEIIKQVLSQVGETCKELLTYSIFYDLTMDDISLKMGLKSADVAKTKNYKCKKRLEKYLNDNPSIKQKLIS